MKRNKFVCWLVINLLLLLGPNQDSAFEFEVTNPMTVSVEKGRDEMNKIMQHSRMPTGSSCWKSALEYLETGCKMMTQETQMRMAFRFTSCFNEMLGLPSIICEASTPMTSCTKELDASSHHRFFEYFLHTQDMCYYLRQEAWQEETKSTVEGLTKSAEEVTEKMQFQQLMQEQIYNKQQETLEIQSTMKQDNKDLANAMAKVKGVFEEFAETAREHQLISTEIFDKLIRMQELVAWIQGEMCLLDMIFFYFAANLFGYFATATTRTRSARFWLIMLFMACIFVERWVFHTFSEAGYSPEDVKAYRWLVRKIASFIGCFIVIIEGARYKDMQSVNNDMLLHMNFNLEKMVDILAQQNSPEKLSPEQNTATSTLPVVADGGTIDESSSDDDTFSNYSSDDSEDNLENELKFLVEDKTENNENHQPYGLTGLSRYFGREQNEKVKPTSLVRSPHTYNLRERSVTPQRNTTIPEESTTEFARVFKRRAPKPAAVPTPPRQNYFSSDDEC